MRHGRILVIDDDRDLQSIVRLELETSNFEVISKFDGVEGLEASLTLDPELIILDINLPSLDGLSVCRRIRAVSDVPVLMLSSLGEDYDKIVGLEVGADDYLGKPFNPRELLARVRALLRRFKRSVKANEDDQPAELKSHCLSHGCIVLDTKKHEVKCGNEMLSLTPIEFSLMEIFLSHPSQVFSRQKLLDIVWGHDFEGTERTVDTHVRNLRIKLGDQSSVIESIRGVGFKLS